MATPSNERREGSQSLTGGLITNQPAHRLPNRFSPDLDNVIVPDYAVERRGGFNQLLKERAKLSCLENTGVARLSRKAYTPSTEENRSYLQVPGIGVGGHRPIYNAISDEWTLALFYSPENLVTEVGLDGVYPSPEIGLKVRPIISKGPLKKTEETNAAWGYGLRTGASTADTGNGPNWDPTTSGTAWGQQGTNEEAMPFCVYLYNAGDISNPDWRFRFSVHGFEAVIGWWLKTCETTTTPVIEGGVYQIICTAKSGGTMRLRIARLIEGEAPSYETVTNDLSSSSPDHGDLTLAKSWCPIQVFDCPQGMIDNGGTEPTDEFSRLGNVTLRPGLGLDTGADGTGYFYTVRRAEGRLEDVAWWRNDQLASDLTALDSREKTDPETAGDDLVLLWSMTEPGMRAVSDVSGRGSDLFLSPAGPVYSKGAGARPTGSWFFNGVTSFVLCDLGDEQTQGIDSGNPNWRQHEVPGAVLGFFLRILESSRDWGVEISFWPDSIEPGFEQVLMEIHDTLRVAIGTDGKLRVYYAINPTVGANNWYIDAPVTSSITFEPGQRYTVTVFRCEGNASGNPGQETRIYVNGKLDTLTDFGNGSDVGNIGGITWGFGSAQRLHYSASGAPGATKGSETHSYNIDHRSGFVGKIESARIVTGLPLGHEPYKHDDPSSDAFLIENLFEADYSGLGKPLGFETKSHMAVPNPLGLDGELVWNPEDLTVAAAGRLESRQGLALRLDHQQNQYEQSAAATSGRLALLTKRFIRYPQETHSTQPSSRYETSTRFRTSEEGGWRAKSPEQRRVVSKLYHTLGRWHFNERDELVEANYPGHYMTGYQLRSFYDGITPMLEGQEDIYRWIHCQRSEVDDDHQVLGPLLRCCMESDVRREFYDVSGTGGLQRPGMAITGMNGVTFLRPYAYTSPQELQPKFRPGIARALPGKCPITLIADWQPPSSPDRFRVVAAGRSIYWAKSPWKVGTPFSDDPLFSKALWLFGQRGEFARALSTDEDNQNISQSGSSSHFNWIRISLWVYPERLDGVRLIALKRAGGQQLVNYAIWTEDGSFHIAGTSLSNTRAWRSRSVTPNAVPPPSDDIPHVHLKVREWNHIHVRLGVEPNKAGTGLQRDLWVNGIYVPLEDDWDSTAPLGIAPDSSATDAELFLGGLPEGADRITYNAASGGPVTVTYQAWHGQMSEFRQTADDEPGVNEDANFPVNPVTDGFVPRSRSVASAATFYLLPLNEGEFWGLTNEAVAASSGHTCTKELVPIRSHLEESAGAPYRFVVFRDRLYITNGRSRPQEILFRSLSDPDGPFRAHDAGILAPVKPRELGTEGAIGPPVPVTSGTPSASTTQAGIYQLWMSFVDADGRESDPTLLYTFQHTTGTKPNEFSVKNLPRSPHPWVVARNIYFSPNGGGVALLHDTINDNDTRDYEVHEWPTAGAISVRPGFQLPMPRARFIAIARGSVILADLADETNGSIAFDFSLPEEAVYFTADGATVIDAEDGLPIIGIRTHLGRVFFNQRNSVWAFAFAGFDQRGIAESYLTPVDTSVGFGGGSSLYNNSIFGASDRGVQQFTGARPVYIGESLEGLWTTVDRSDDGLRAMWGVFYQPDSQYMLSVRRKGERNNDTIFVLHTSLPAGMRGDDGVPPWTQLTVPEHSYLQRVTDEDDQDTSLLMGSTSGHVLIYRRDLDVDIAGDWTIDNQTMVLTASVSSISADQQTITLSTSSLDTVRDGLAGVKVKFGNGEERTILRNTASSITVTKAVSTSVPATLNSATIGGFFAYYTTPWHEPQKYGKGIRVDYMDLDFVPPSSSSILVEWLTAYEPQGGPSRPAARMFDRSVAEQAPAVDGSQGFLSQPISTRGEQGHGRYFRMLIGTDGVKKPFALSGYGFRWFPVGQRGAP